MQTENHLGAASRKSFDE